jgi:hypothetical protein
VLDQLADPGRVDHIALAAGDVVQVLSIQKPALEALLEDVEARLPIDPGRLHPDQGHVEAGKPVAERRQLRDRRAESARLPFALPPALSRYPHGRHHAVAVHIEARAPLNQDIHPFLLPRRVHTGVRRGLPLKKLRCAL